MKLIHNRGVLYLRQNTVLMADWDVEDGNKELVKQQAVDAVKALVDRDPTRAFALYTTPNGVHAFQTSALCSIEEANEDDFPGSCTDYWKCCRDRKCYGARVTRKSRPGDYVAQAWMTIGDAPMHPEVEKFLHLHDFLCRLGRHMTAVFPYEWMMVRIIVKLMTGFSL